VRFQRGVNELCAAKKKAGLDEKKETKGNPDISHIDVWNLNDSSIRLLHSIPAHTVQEVMVHFRPRDLSRDVRYGLITPEKLRVCFWK